MKKRENYDRPTWDEYFAHEVWWAATRSTCQYLQAGAVIVKANHRIASGYNGATSKIENCLERGCRKDEKGVEFEEKGKDVCRGAHAESNAIKRASKEDLIGSVLYTVYYPCAPCAKEIIQTGITEVIWFEEYKKSELAKELFEEAGIKVRKMDWNLEKDIEYLKKIHTK